ncbi:C6 transcription factor [Sarocladium implicatum]|nr:C6 transcription factor [Sarocladium implicatum]
MAFIYPVVPCGHEPTLRLGVSVFSRDTRPSVLGPASSLRADSPQLAYMKRFCQTTAICAFVFSTAPVSLMPLKDVLAGPFLQASRAMLSSYEIYDLEFPDSASLVIRAWHASAMQNTSGKHGAAAQTHMGAELLALRLRLYDEAAVTKYDAHEAQQLRAIFWILHHSDKASVAFSSRIYILNESSFDGQITVQEHGDLTQTPHLALTPKFNDPPLDEHIHASFHKKRRMWMYAADLIKAVRAYPRVTDPPRDYAGSPGVNGPGGETITQSELDRLSTLYLTFTGSMEVIPSWFALPEQPRLPNGELDPETTQYRERSCWAMRSNMMTSFHCLKLIILQECCSRGLHSVMGLGDSEMLLAVRKMDIAQDFLYELQIVPFESFKMQGEPGVQRVRQVGSRMLELVENAANDVIRARARSQFRQLLDYLSKLDSKVSDELE